MNNQIYYHFLCYKNAIEDLDKERIKVSLINELNDPFELLPYLRFQNKERRNRYTKIRNNVSNKYGLLSFCKSWDEPLLWGHYACKHKGIALGFEILTENIIEVNYFPGPKRTKFRLTADSEENEKRFLDLAKIKYKKWAYENEYRILVKLNDCKEDKNMKFLELNDKLKVKEIILGCKFEFYNNKKLETLIRLAEKLEAKIKPTRQGWEDYKIRQCGTKTKDLQDKK